MLAHWSDNESLAGRVRVFSRWRNNESAAGGTTVLARWRDDVHSQHGGWRWRLGPLFGRLDGDNSGETMVFWYHHSLPTPVTKTAVKTAPGLLLGLMLGDPDKGPTDRCR